MPIIRKPKPILIDEPTGGPDPDDTGGTGGTDTTGGDAPFEPGTTSWLLPFGGRDSVWTAISGRAASVEDSHDRHANSEVNHLDASGNPFALSWLVG